MSGNLPGSGSSSPCDAADRESRINEVALDAFRRLRGGLSVDEDAVLREHADLQPELEERLKDVRIMLAAQQRVEKERGSGAAEFERELLKEELETLSKSLPQYEIRERLRHGGQGRVYHACQRSTRREVAIKVLLDGPLATDRQRYRFEREVELVARLRHPNIVSVFESGTVRGRLYYAMEFVEGLPIDYYARLHELTPRELVRLMIKVCGAIAYAHLNGVIHRDLSPHNILVDEAGEPRIFDFGLAKDTLSGDGPHSCTGMMVGTPPYVSPEQMGALDGRVDVRSDVYCLGVLLYELLSGRLPYPDDDDLAALRTAILTMEPVPLRRAVRLSADELPEPGAINRDLEMILAKALAKSKEDRYQSAEAFADDLEHFLAGEAVRARAGHALYVLHKAIRKNRWRLAVGCTLAAVIAGSWFNIRAERDNARRAASIAYRLFDTALSDVEESVRPLAGGVAVRDRLVDRLAVELAQLQRLAEADRALDPLLPQLLEKQGDIALEQGQREHAAAYYDAFAKKCLASVQNGPSELDAAAIRACRKRAETAADAEAWYESGIRHAQAILGRSPDDEDVRYELAHLRAAYASWRRNASKYEQALDQVGEALALLPPAAREVAPEQRWSRLELTLITEQSISLRQLGEGERAADALKRSVALCEQAVAHGPADVEARHQLLRAYMGLGSLYADAEDVEGGKTYLLSAAEVGRYLTMMDPTSTRWDRDYYVVLERLTVLHLRTGRISEAEEACREAEALAHRRLALGDTSDAARDLVALSYVLRGRVLMAMGGYEEAQRSFQEAAAIHEGLSAAAPENMEQMKRLANVNFWLGTSTRQLRGDGAAFPYYRHSCEILLRLHQRSPNHVATALDVVAAQCSLAAAYMRLDDASNDGQARSLLDEAEAILHELSGSGTLHGYESWVNERHRAIEKNHEILDLRAERRGEAGS